MKVTIDAIPLSDLKSAIPLIHEVFIEFETTDYSAEGMQKFEWYIEHPNY